MQLFNYPWVLGLLMAIVLAGAIEAGQRVAVRLRIQEDAQRKEQMQAIRDGLFVMTSLLLGFTLALAAPRFADRRSLLIDEANAVGTSFRRAQTLPSPTREQAQELLRHYVDAHIDLNNAGLDDASLAKAENRLK